MARRSLATLVLGAALVAALGAGARAAGFEEMDEDMVELAGLVRETCLGETGVDLKLVLAVNDGADLTLMTDPVLKCYMRCVMETAGMFTDGKVDVDAVLEMMPETLSRKNEGSIRRCGSPPDPDLCEVAYKTQLCWQLENKEDYFLI